jgi:hypothetical protein
MKTPVALILFAASAIALAAPTSYVDAKSKADRDEASLGDAGGALVEAQGNVLGPVLASCGASTGAKDLSPFVVVMELDATGRIVQTWRQGSSAISACFERGIAGKTLVTPPRVPFYTSFEMHFN